MIISFASSKGGVGKSTICAAIGARLAQRGEEVLILDLDQNRTVERWGRKTKITGLTVTAIERDSFTTVIREAAATSAYDHILIDLTAASPTCQAPCPVWQAVELQPALSLARCLPGAG